LQTFQTIIIKPDTTFHSFELIEKVPGTDNLLARFLGRAWGDGAQHIALFESRTGQKFGNNIQVLVRVKVNFHATYGLQLQLTDLDHTFTLGVLEQQRQQTLKKLCRENPQLIKKDGEDYWTKNKSLQLPGVIQKIAVITGKTSAGWQDFHHSLETNLYSYKFSITSYFTDVQGKDKALAMQNALVDIFQSSTQYDLVVIIRGGGAQPDLLLFDHYLVGRAIARFPVPVFTGIGHQKNITIADMMAHTSLKTPTKVADAIINHNRQFEDQLVTIQKTILIKAQ
jgi:exodeoxyribonuclease VII large subunit